MFAARIRVIVDPLMPTRSRVRFPKKGPYYKKRLKRTALDPKNYRWPARPFLMIGQERVICHPDYLPTLKETLRKIGVIVV